jgi:O-antigen/teichoic acid export membrane protein
MLTRLYSPSEYGLFAIYLALLLVFGIIGTFRYDQVIFSLSADEASSAFKAGVKAAICLSIMLFVVTIIAVSLLGVPKIYILLSFNVLFFSVVQLGISVLSLDDAHNKISIIYITRAITASGLQMLIALIWDVGFGLVVGQFLSSFIVFLYVINLLKFNLSLRAILKIKVFRFDCLNSTIQSLANSLSNQLPNFFVPYLYGTGVAGYYALAFRLTQLPINFLSNAIRPLILSEFKKIRDDTARKRTLLVKGTVGFFLTGALGFLLIFLFAEEFFRFYSGSEWAESGRISIYLAAWFMVAFANVFSVSLLTELGRFGFLLKFELVVFVLRSTICVYVLTFKEGLYSFLLYYSSLGVVANIYLITYVMWKEK